MPGQVREREKKKKSKGWMDGWMGWWARVRVIHRSARNNGERVEEFFFPGGLMLDGRDKRRWGS